jgi:SAM-dependent methyltransferase
MSRSSHGLQSVKEYYGKVLKTNKDLRTNACCPIDAMPAELRSALTDIHPEVLEKFYGCGSPIPPALQGKVVLDLGSGSGRDSFILSKRVGPTGKVIGIDMTGEQIAVAAKHIPYHMDRFGYSKPNVEFIQGYIEDLRTAGIQDQSVDVVVSNCVVNLSPRKDLVFSEIFRVLKPGGELYFSDVFSSRRIPEELTRNEIFVGECLGGALYTEDFRRLLNKLGCPDFRITARNKITINDQEMQALAGMIEFSSVTIRAFNLDLEDRCEDYGQVATYLGTVEEAPNVFVLDDHHAFEKGRGIPICANTASMLQNTRYGKHFSVAGSTSTHFGLFDCGPIAPAGSPSSTPGACC